ncbi:MAG: phosphatase PAP2 family protein [Candidatus Heimdallarchaeota archaeon]|nr:phosphatase PAP2 family protein [Candidatus Heimdallarchaeota archaeon]MCK5144184.1 phosphatase PAP2 family protein [Candidatus Heimdallarchaeota archaeon]
MRKRNLIAIIMSSVGAALIVAAMVLVYTNDPLRGISSLDYKISEFFLNNSTGTGTTIMKIVTFLGDAIIYIAVLIILYYVWDKKKAYRAIVALVSTTVVNASTKAAFKLPRPDNTFGHTIKETTFGLPSGHTQLSTSLWGVLASFVFKWGMLIVSIALPLLIAFSRIYLVVHWFTDVLMGFGIGLIFLAIFLVVLNPVENYFENKSIAVKILWSIAVGIVFSIPIVLLFYRIPSTGLESIMSNMRYIAIFTTVSISYAIEGKLINFDNRIEKWWKGILRVLLAIVVLAGVYLYGEFFDPDPVTTLKMILDLVIYALLGPIFILLLPWIIKKLNL